MGITGENGVLGLRERGEESVLEEVSGERVRIAQFAGALTTLRTQVQAQEPLTLTVSLAVAWPTGYDIRGVTVWLCHGP